MSFRKSFHKDIVPATISSWIKQTVLLCYQLSDQSAQAFHQVKAHDVRAFQGGVSGLGLGRLRAVSFGPRRGSPTDTGGQIDHFIALIHPIQWTNAIPVGATGSSNVRKRRPVFPLASRS